MKNLDLNGEIGKYHGVKIVVIPNIDVTLASVAGPDGTIPVVDMTRCVLMKAKKAYTFVWGEEPRITVSPFGRKEQTDIVLASAYEGDVINKDAVVQIKAKELKIEYNLETDYCHRMSSDFNNPDMKEILNQAKQLKEKVEKEIQTIEYKAGQINWVDSEICNAIITKYNYELEKCQETLKILNEILKDMGKKKVIKKK